MKKLLLFIGIILCLNGFSQSTLTDDILTHMDNKNVSGLAAVVVTDSGIVWEGYYGLANREDSIPVTDSTIFMLASISKTITATALLQLWEDGLFELDDDINAYLPFEVQHPSHPDSSITFRQLLCHTASIEDNWDVLESLYTSGDSPISLFDFLSQYFTPGGLYYSATNNFYGYAPGGNYQYSNVGSALCGLLAETISGLPFNEYCNTHIFEPLCMENTAWFLSELNEDLVARPYSFQFGSYQNEGLYGYPDYPDGQLRTTARSLAKFLYTYMQEGTFEGYNLLESETIDSIWYLQIPDITDDQGLTWYTWTVNGVTLWGHSGGDAGVSTDMYVDLDQQRGYIILTNGNAWNTPVLESLMETGPADWYATAIDMECNLAATASNMVPLQESASLYPNPAQHQTTLLLPATGHTRYRLLDVQARPLTAWLRLPETGVIALSGWPAGHYIVQWNHEQFSGSNRLIIQPE